MSSTKIGFGTYRVTDRLKAHHDALTHALQNGINIIDTSSNYTDTRAHMLIGQVLEKFDRSEITIIDKFGYLQGENLKRLQEGLAVEDLVPYQEGCYHSIHPDFMRDQLDRALKRLRTSYIDEYLIHNPEYYLMFTIKEERDKARHQAIMLERIYKAFVALELEVQNGRIRSYGISSNSFSKKTDELHFLPYEALVELAQKAADEIGSPTHHFTTIQLPINLLEQEGLECARWAKANGLKVVVNRPLNAFDESGMYRLAEYKAMARYEEDKEKILTLSDTYAMSEIRTIVSDLDGLKAKFDWVGGAESVLYNKAVPFIRGVIKRLDDAIQKEFQKAFDQFFVSYLWEVKASCSNRAREHLKTVGIEPDEDLSCYAINWLRAREEIDVVLVGMRTVAYVDNVLACKE